MKSVFDVKVWFFIAALLACGGCAGVSAAPIAPLSVSTLLRVDWQDPQALPRRLRNHCSTDGFSGRPYCSDHCGAEYQVYYCSPHSFGCCRVGYGYCDWNGLVRCHP